MVGAYVEELRGHMRDMPAEAGVHARLAMELGICAYEAELEWTTWAESQIGPAARGGGLRMPVVDGERTRTSTQGEGRRPSGSHLPAV